MDGPRYSQSDGLITPVAGLDVVNTLELVFGGTGGGTGLSFDGDTSGSKLVDTAREGCGRCAADELTNE